MPYFLSVFPQKAWRLLPASSERFGPPRRWATYADYRKKTAMAGSRFFRNSVFFCQNLFSLFLLNFRNSAGTSLRCKSKESP